jgi:hypothetical protein
MSLERNFRELFSQSVTLFPCGVGQHRQVWEAFFHGIRECQRVRALCVGDVLRRSPEGREVVEDGRFYLYGVFPVTNDYKIRLEDGSEPVISRGGYTFR